MCPSGWNPADFLLDVVSGIGPNSGTLDSADDHDDSADVYVDNGQINASPHNDDSHTSALIGSRPRETSLAHSLYVTQLSSVWKDKCKSLPFQSETPSHSALSTLPPARQKSSFFLQLRVLSKRTILYYIRNPVIALQSLFGTQTRTRRILLADCGRGPKSNYYMYTSNLMIVLLSL